MKKLLLTASALVLTLGMAQNANAECNGIYLGIRGGATSHDTSAKHGEQLNSSEDYDDWRFMISGALGYRYDYYRTELEYVWRDKGKWHAERAGGIELNNDLKTTSYMWNHYIDFLPYNWWTPYVNAGLGFTKIKYNQRTTTPLGGTVVNPEGYNNTPTRFTWSVGAGMSVKVTNRVNVDAGYRYYDMGSVRYMDIDAHEVYGGLRYVF